MLNAMLEKAGYPPVALKAGNAREYFAAFERAQMDDASQDFIRMLTENVRAELDGRMNAVSASGPAEEEAGRAFLLYESVPKGEGSRRLKPLGTYSSLLEAIDAVGAEGDSVAGKSARGSYAVYGCHQDILADEPHWTSG